MTIDGTFAPADLTVHAGDRVVWTNKDPYPHTATSKTGSFDSDDIKPARSWTFVAKKKGDFPYVCSIHPSMKGTLHVNVNQSCDREQARRAEKPESEPGNRS